MPIPANIEAVSTKPGGVSLFTHDVDGQFYVASFDPENLGSAQLGGWGDWVPLGPDRFPERTPISGVSTKRAGVTLFAVNADGRVWHTVWDPDNLGPAARGGWQPWRAIGANTFPLLSRVCAVSPAPRVVDIFVQDGNGSIWTTRRDPLSGALAPNGGWQVWRQIGPHRFPTPSTITAVSTTRRGVNIFISGRDGQVWSTYRDPYNVGPLPGGWHIWFNLGPHHFPSPVTVGAVSTRERQLGIYTLGFDEQVYGVHYEVNTGWQVWRTFGPNKFPRPAAISAVTTKPSGTSLFVMGFDGRVWTKFFDPDNLGPPDRGGWSEWRPVGGQKTFPTPSAVTAVSTKPGGVSLFAMDAEGGVWTSWYDPHYPGPKETYPWHGWTRVGTRTFRRIDPVLCVRLHVKVLTTPAVEIMTLINTMDQIFQVAGVRVAHMTNEFLNLPLLNALDAGACLMGATTTAEQDQLFNNFNMVGPLDVVAYFVQSITLSAGGVLAGCAQHPPIRFGSAVASIATQPVLAHECGHVLGLTHPDDALPPPSKLVNRLMTSAPLANTSVELTTAEIAQMRSHPRCVLGSTV